MKPGLLGALALLVLALSTPAQADEFWHVFGDGKAEVDSYALVQPRYGAPRAGTAVLIFVTEDMSDAARVKPEPGRSHVGDVYPVLKLNFIRAFQTGIYDYHTMSSTFARTDWTAGAAAWPVVKTSFSSQEWCGNLFMEWLTRGRTMLGALHSYFDGEGDATIELPAPADGVREEAIPILVRGLRGDWLAPGESRSVPFFPSSFHTRLWHRPQVWGHARVRRTVDGRRYVVVYDGVTTTWSVDPAPPHHILGWHASDGESGRLVGSARLPYWKLNAPGGERYLRPLGLSPLPLIRR